ncbi:uncharacterized protein LOC127720994 [Mytilus californianus]|uniref:uncharacterized protein LOC127720994 n=1 Tax=Mytilus californianus TaxID=6549 RepID=UPI0022482974|nr:uncharacterized protein LOC127720994 [Mytilus californianus]
MINSTQCLYVDLSGTVEFADCHLKYPFLCTSDKTIQDQEYYSTDITEINVASSLAIHEVIYNLTNEECGTSCKSLFSCVYSTYEENNCTIWKDMAYDVYVSYDLSISSGSMTNNSIFIKTSNRVHIILIEEDTVYNNTFNCVFSFPLQNTTEQSANLTVCEFCPNAEKCNATSFAANITLEVALEVAEDLRKNLTVDKTSLSSYRRRLECADDSRPSSKVFGGFALGVLVGLVVIAIVLDCPTLTRHLRLCNVRNKKYKDLEQS